MNTKSPQPDKRLVDFATILQLEKLTRKTQNAKELFFLMVNETYRLVPYKQAFFWHFTHGGKAKIAAASGVEMVDAASPLISFLEKFLAAQSKTKETKKISKFSLNELPKSFSESWKEWLPPQALSAPILNAKGDLCGGLLLVRDAPFADSDKALLELINDAYAYQFSLYAKKDKTLGKSPINWVLRYGLVGLIALILAYPVADSVTAPARVVASSPQPVNSPFSGVIKEIKVEPNQMVDVGETLFLLDGTVAENRLLATQKDLAVAEAELHKARQLAFSRPEDQANIALLSAKIGQYQAEVDYAAEVLSQLEIKATASGLVLFSSVSEWLGRPVSTGERIMTIANPNEVELEISVPAMDAVALDKGAKVSAFLNIAPLSPYKANLRSAAYAPEIMPEGFAAYLARAEFDNAENLPRIGLQATAKVYDNRKVPLLLHIFRRPLARLRQAVGF